MNPETPDFKRLFLAVFLMTALLMLYNTFLGPTKPAVKTSVPPQPSSEPAVALPPVAVQKIENKDTPIITQQLSKFFPESVAIRGGYKVLFSSEGAQLQNFSLLGYQKPIQFNPGFWIESRNNQLSLSKQSRYELVRADLTSLAFQKITPENVQIIHQYELTDKPYVVRHSIELHNLSQHSQSLALDLVLQLQEHTKHPEDPSVTWSVHNKQHRFSVSDLEKKLEQVSSSPQYIGFDRRYFLVSIAPETPEQIEGAEAQLVHLDSYKNLQIKLKAQPLELSPGSSKTLSFSSYLGPKQLNLLQTAGHGIEENLDYGWFGVLSRPLLWLLVFIYNWVHNFGIAIILLTVLIKLLTFPLTQKSFESQQEMKKIQPELKELQKKYSHDKAMLGQKQMAFYKEKGINPMAGCLPMLIQMPVWFALYQMLGNSVELYEQPFYSWILDLTQPDPYYVFPVLMGLSMLISQWVIPPTIDESQPQMKYVLWFMPLFLTFIMLSLPAGLSLYMLTNNLLTIAQQVYVRQRLGGTT